MYLKKANTTRHNEDTHTLYTLNHLIRVRNKYCNTIYGIGEYLANKILQTYLLQTYSRKTISR